MSVDYLVNGRRFIFSYRNLREEWLRQCALSDEEFVAQLPVALHLACMIGWLKELGADATIGDAGLVHELVHLFHEGTPTPLSAIRDQFRLLLELA
jgi:hypothetical protein